MKCGLLTRECDDEERQMDHLMYNKIIDVFMACGSITDTAHRMKVSEERVRRTLITEGLWSSRSSDAIGKLYREGKIVPEIAKALSMSEKNVQSYVPYSRGMYGGERTDTAKRSDAYRKRMRRAAEKMGKKDSERKQAGRNGADSGDDGKDRTGKDRAGKTVKSKRKKKGEADMRKTAIRRTRKQSSKTVKGNYGIWNSVLGERKLELPEEPSLNNASVYKVRFELVGSFDNPKDQDMAMPEAERLELLYYAKAERAIAREVLLPGRMNLHALHYLIQRLFGWQDSHLHNFALHPEVFCDMTGETVAGWLSLCGKLLQFPTDGGDDLFGGEEYQPGMSVKNWLRKKCLTQYRYIIADEMEDLYDREINDFRERFPWVTDRMSLEDVVSKIAFEADLNTLAEWLTLHELLPAFRELYYLYDYGDGWCVRISMMEKYDRKTNADLCEDGWELEDIFTAKDMLKKYRYVADKSMQSGWDKKTVFDTGVDDGVVRNGGSAGNGDKRLVVRYEGGLEAASDPDFRFENEVDETLREVLASVDVNRQPLCTLVDGLGVLDDVGGVYGMLEFYRTINGDDAEEKREAKEWARMLGWTGRMTKAGNMV